MMKRRKSKKILIIAIAALIMITIGGGIFLYLRKIRPVSIDEILPEGPLLYIRASHIAKNIDGLTDTQLWRQLKKVDYDLLMEGVKLDKDKQVMFKLFAQQFSNPQAQEVLRKIFGREIAFVAYPTEFEMPDFVEADKDFVKRLGKDLFSNVYIVTRVAEDVQFVEFMMVFLQKVAKDLFTEVVKYKGHLIYSLVLPDVELKMNFVRVKDLMIFCFGDDSAWNILDTYHKERKSLAKSQVLEEVKEKSLESSDMECFVDIARLSDMMRNQTEKMDAWIEEGIFDDDEGQSRQSLVTAIQRNFMFFSSSAKGFFDQIKYFRIFGASLRWGKVVQSNYHIFLDKEEMDKQWEKALLCPDGENPSIRFVPRDVIGYYWSRCFDIKKTMEDFVTSTNKLSAMKKSSGLSGVGRVIPSEQEDKIFPLFGNEMGGYLEDISTTEPFPSPKAAVFFSTTDKDQLANFIEGLIEATGFNLAKDNYKGTTTKFLSLPLLPQIKPGYCFIENYLILALDQETLKRSVDAFKDETLALSDNKDFQAIDLGLTGKNRSTAFAKVDILSEKLKEFVRTNHERAVAEEERKKAFHEGRVKRLEDIHKELSEKENKLVDLKGEISYLDGEIQRLQRQEIDPAEKVQEREAIEKDKEILQNDIYLLKAQERETLQVVESYSEPVMKAEERQEALEQVVYPFLEALKKSETFGLKFNIDSATLSWTIFLKVN